MAQKLASKSDHGTYLIAAVIIRGGAVLSKATNTKGTSIPSEAYTKMVCRGHAEARAISNRDFKGATLIVARHNGGTSKPCPQCQKMIETAGITTVVYVDDKGIVIKTRT